MPDATRLLNFMEKCNEAVGQENLNKPDGFFKKYSKGIIDESIARLNGRLLPGMRVLDVGCGKGYALKRFKELGLTPTGVTLSDSDAQELSGQGYDVRLADAHFMDFTDESFDVVWARHTLEHCLIPYFVLSEIYRVLAYDGTFYMEVPAPSKKGHHESNEWHYSIMPARMWVSLLERAGFKDIESYEIRFDEGMDMYYQNIARKRRVCG